MSVQALYTAATGMSALETKLDVVANNLSNVNTVGYKRGRANFEDLFYRHEKLPGGLDAQGNPTATGTSIGLGTRVSSIQSHFNQGAFQQTGGQLDVAIEGSGFFQVRDPSSNSIYYTRAGNFSLNASKQIVLGSAQTGRLLEPPIQVPQDATDVQIEPDGKVMVRQGNNLTEQGQILLAQFVNPEGLLRLGENLFAETQASGTPITGNPRTNGIGALRSNMLEASNVEPVQELIDLITTQRSFELNSQAVKVGDEVLQLISNLRRG